MTSVKWGLIANRVGVGGKSPNNSLGERGCDPKVTNRYRFEWASRSDRGLPDVHP
jgi:hypothetical protein